MNSEAPTPPGNPLWRAWLDRSIAEPKAIKSGAAKRALVLGCSMTKDEAPSLLPAFQRYQGPLWQTLRNSGWNPLGFELLVFAVSAKMGLISALMPIRNYNVSLNDPIPGRRGQTYGSRLETDTSRLAWRELLTSPLEIAVAAGDAYLSILRQWATPSQIDISGRCKIFAGGIGEKRQEMALWIRNTMPL